MAHVSQHADSAAILRLPRSGRANMDQSKNPGSSVRFMDGGFLVKALDFRL